MQVCAISFDAYGTLFEGGTDRLIQLLHEKARSAGLDATQLLREREELIAELPRRAFMKMEARDVWILDTLFKRHRLPGDPVALAADLNRHHREATLIPDALPTLDSLRAQPLAITSNADVDMMDALLRNAGVRDRFTAVVTSESAQAYKPAPTIYAATATALRTPPAEIVHVGDSYVADVVGAHRAGMRTVWIQQAGGLPAAGGQTARPDAVIKRLADLPGALERLARA